VRARTRSALAFTVAAAAILALPSAAAASFDIAIAHTESADPVARGAQVTYTTTLTNEGGEAFDGVGLDLFGLAAGSEAAVPNPYRSATPSQGACAIEPAGDYQQALCDLGTLDPGESARVTSVVELNVSTDNVAGLLRCDFGPLTCTAFSDDDPSDDQVSERTTAVVPPLVEGSAKLKLKGLPAGCIAQDTRIKAKAKVSKVKQIKAKLTGKNLRERLGRAAANKLAFTLDADELEQARFYELNVNVTRKGAPGIKRSVELQRC
jgi:Domain of unknown function DUF11